MIVALAIVLEVIAEGREFVVAFPPQQNSRREMSA